jgi:osmoprotectant transport system substrate-binding protein
LLLALALLLPILAACGDDDEDPTATSAGADTTVTSGTGADATATDGMGEATETTSAGDATETTGTGGDATATEGMGEATETAGTGDATETAGTGGEATGTTSAGGDNSDITITVGSKNFTEQLILGEMYAQILEDRGFNVERSLNLGGTLVAHEALLAGEIDLYPEYTGTGLLVILGMETMSDPDEVYDVVSTAYLEDFDLVWLDQTPMNNSNALAVTREWSEENGVTTISELAEVSADLTLAAVPDFPEREDGQIGLEAVYGLEFGEVLIFDPGLKYQAFLDGEADVVLAFGTDGQVAGYDLVILEDDQGLWPPYHVAPVVRQETLDEAPEVAEALNELAPLLTSDVMSALNWQVDGPDAMEPADVAQAFLEENGLIGGQ